MRQLARTLLSKLKDASLWELGEARGTAFTLRLIPYPSLALLVYKGSGYHPGYSNTDYVVAKLTSADPETTDIRFSIEESQALLKACDNLKERTALAERKAHKQRVLTTEKKMVEVLRGCKTTTR